MAKVPKLRGNALHHDRYTRHKGGMSIEEIAQQDAVSVFTIQQSINAAHAYRNLCNATELEISQYDVVLSVADLQKQGLAEALRATKMIKVGNRWKEVPDHEVRMRAQELIPTLVTAARPKAGGHVTQVNVNQQVAQTNTEPQLTPTGKSIESFEDVLRRVKERKQLEAVNQPSDVVIEVPDGSPPSG